jgi:hypothetical protein
VTRRGLIADILNACGSRRPVPNEPEDLPHLGEIIEARSVTLLALIHFDLVAARPHYALDFFSTLRHLMMDTKKLVLLIQSRDHFANLLPANNPLSDIDIKTVELRGTT